MKKIILIVLLVFCFTATAQEKWSTKNGSIQFEASVPSFEEVKAKNEQVGAILKSDGTIACLALMNGFRFEVTVPISVYALGAWDDAGNGFASALDVAIFPDGGGAPLVQTTLAAGSGSPLVDGFRYGAVAPTAGTGSITERCVRAANRRRAVRGWRTSPDALPRGGGRGGR